MISPGKQRVRNILSGTATSGAGLWLGNPHADTVRLYCRRPGVSGFEALRLAWGDDCRWIAADGAYRHPEGKPALDPYLGRPKLSHGQPGVFADCESTAAVERYPWPDPQYLGFTSLRARLLSESRFAVFSGMWAPFFHNVADFFGMENYFVKMHTHPAVVEAVTDHVVGYYMAANQRFFEECGDLVDAYFFGNDFGSQENLLISPSHFARFVLPYFRKLVGQAKTFGLPVILHSCGAVAKVIPALLDAGIDGLHPLQARARGMSADELARQFRGQLAFMGGVDTQELLITAAPDDIKREVHRLRAIFGERFIVSPSHEAVLPNVPLENLQAMAEAAKE